MSPNKNWGTGDWMKNKNTNINVGGIYLALKSSKGFIVFQKGVLSLRFSLIYLRIILFLSIS